MSILWAVIIEHIKRCVYYEEAIAFDQQAIKAFLLASLLHDIGHYGFAHYREETGIPILSHERLGRRIIEESEIATILEREYEISPQRVADLIDPPHHRDLFRRCPPVPTIKWIY